MKTLLAVLVLLGFANVSRAEEVCGKYILHQVSAEFDSWGPDSIHQEGEVAYLQLSRLQTATIFPVRYLIEGVVDSYTDNGQAENQGRHVNQKVGVPPALRGVQDGEKICVEGTLDASADTDYGVGSADPNNPLSINGYLTVKQLLSR